MRYTPVCPDGLAVRCRALELDDAAPDHAAARAQEAAQRAAREAAISAVFDRAERAVADHRARRAQRRKSCVWRVPLVAIEVHAGI